MIGNELDEIGGNLSTDRWILTRDRECVLSNATRNALVTFQRIVDVQCSKCVQVNIIQIDFGYETEKVPGFGGDLQCPVNTAVQDDHIAAFLLYERAMPTWEGMSRIGTYVGENMTGDPGNFPCQVFGLLFEDLFGSEKFVTNFTWLLSTVRYFFFGVGQWFGIFSQTVNHFTNLNDQTIDWLSDRKTSKKEVFPVHARQAVYGICSHLCDVFSRSEERRDFISDDLLWRSVCARRHDIK